MTIGITDLKHVIQIPGTWDLSYLKKWEIGDGTTFDRLVAQVGAALVLFNRSLTSGYWGRYLQTTTEMTYEYDTGGDSDELEGISEYTRPDPLKAKTTGHMLPMKDYGGALGWTYIALRRGKSSNLIRGVRRLVERGQNTWERRLLERLFGSAAETVGSTGVSVPFADGGTADATYVPGNYEGRTFDNTHTHFDRKTADAAGRSAALLAGMYHLLEHGIRGPYDIVIPEVDAASWTAQTEFTKPERGILSTAGVEVRAGVPEEEFLGIVETDWGWGRIKSVPRLPTAYMGMFKPGGFGSPANPLVVRYEEGFPLGLAIVGRVEQFPLQDAIAYFTFGAGIANRLAGYCCYFAASGNYTDPTIS